MNKPLKLKVMQGETIAAPTMKSKQGALYEKSLNLANNKMKRVWFNTHHHLEKEGRDTVNYAQKDSRYTQPLQSIVVCEKILSDDSVHKKETTDVDFWKMIYDESWDAGSAVRVFDGQLFTSINCALRYMVEEKVVEMSERYVYGKTVSIKKPTLKMGKKSESEDTVRISYTYFRLCGPTNGASESMESVIARTEITEDINARAVIVVDDELVVENATIVDGTEERPPGIDIQLISASTSRALATDTPTVEGLVPGGHRDQLSSMNGLTCEIPLDPTIISDVSGAVTDAQAETENVMDLSNITGRQLSEIPRDISNKTDEQFADISRDHTPEQYSQRSGRSSTRQNSAIGKVSSFQRPTLYHYDNMYLSDTTHAGRVESMEEKLARRKLERITNRKATLEEKRKIKLWEKEISPEKRYKQLQNVGKILQNALDEEMHIPSNTAMTTLPFEWYLLRLLFDEVKFSSAVKRTADMLYERFSAGYFVTNNENCHDLLPKELIEELIKVYNVGNNNESSTQTKKTKNRKILVNLCDTFLGRNFLTGKKQLEPEEILSQSTTSPLQDPRKRKKKIGMNIPESKLSETARSDAKNYINDQGAMSKKQSSERKRSAKKDDISKTVENMESNRNKQVMEHTPKLKKDFKSKVAETISEFGERINRSFKLDELSDEDRKTLKFLLKSDRAHFIDCIVCITMGNAFRVPIAELLDVLTDTVPESIFLTESRVDVNSDESDDRVWSAGSQISSVELKSEWGESIPETSKYSDDESGGSVVGYKYWVVGVPRASFRAKQLYMKKLHYPLLSYTCSGTPGEMILGPTSDYIKSAFKYENPPYDILFPPKDRWQGNLQKLHSPIKDSNRQDGKGMYKKHKCSKYGKKPSLHFDVKDYADDMPTKTPQRFARINRRFSEAAHKSMQTYHKKLEREEKQLSLIGKRDTKPHHRDYRADWSDSDGFQLYKADSDDFFRKTSGPRTVQKIAELYSCVKAFTSIRKHRSKFDLSSKPTTHAFKRVVLLDENAESASGQQQFRENLKRAMDQFVIRREVVTSSVDFCSITCITFNRPYQFLPVNYLDPRNVNNPYV